MAFNSNGQRMKVAAGVVVAGMVMLGGCTHWGEANYPPIAGDTISNDVNQAPTPQVVTAALHYAVRRFPVNGGFALNLPLGTNALRAEQIVQGVGKGAAMLTEENKSLPIFHVSRVWVRGSHARVDILRPVTMVGDKPMSGVYQTMTLHMRVDGGWKVETVQVYAAAPTEPPALYMLPKPEPMVEPKAAPVEPAPAAAETDKKSEDAPATKPEPRKD